ncbi:hypothetical protein [Pajaroellobacter abortibovis]|uniref:hypothetical protein n=1 Tax=Pajaroellobacter abortibovis TaxID=1882918 RepID=UPI0012EBA776|nr:hypothetical protein [Pajaroellobacter abortibovis]
MLVELGCWLTGSTAPLYKNGHAAASINFVTAHDDFTLHDPIAYEVKRDRAN